MRLLVLSTYRIENIIFNQSDDFFFKNALGIIIITTFITTGFRLTLRAITTKTTAKEEGGGVGWVSANQR